MHLLLVRQDKLGDNVLATAIPRAVRQAAPNIEISVMAQPCFREIWLRHPDVSGFVPICGRPRPQHILGLALRLRGSGADAVALLKRNSGEVIIASRLAGIPARIGAAHKPYKRHLTANRMEDCDKLMHEVDRGLRIAGQAVGADLERQPLVFDPKPEEMERVRALVPRDFFIVHPTTGGTAPAVSPEVLADGVRWLMQQTGLACVYTGGPGEALAAPLAALPNCTNLMGRLSLWEAAAACRLARMVVVGNTSMMHIAAAQRTPVLALETRRGYRIGAVRWAPWMTLHTTVLPQNEAGEFTDLTAAMLRRGVCELLERLSEEQAGTGLSIECLQASQ